jgi:hypothetical protein
MRDEACRAAIEFHRIGRRGNIVSDHLMNLVPRFNEVRELMDRPAARRWSRTENEAEDRLSFRPADTLRRSTRERFLRKAIV